LAIVLTSVKSSEDRAKHITSWQNNKPYRSNGKAIGASCYIETSSYNGIHELMHSNDTLNDIPKKKQCLIQ
jgi:hypothetical protein